MADYLGSIGGGDDQGESVDYLGKAVKTAFKSEPALPAGAGPAPGVAAAPSTIGGAGTAPGASVASAGGERAGSQGPSTLAQIAQWLGLANQLGSGKFQPSGGAISATGAVPAGEFGDFLTRSGLTQEQFETLLQSLPPGWMEGMDIPGLDEAKFAPPPEIPDTGLGPSPVGGDAAARVGPLTDAPGAGDVTDAGGLGTGLVGAGLAGASQLTRDKNLGLAANAASLGGSLAELSAATFFGAAGPGAVFALPAAGYAGMNLADSIETAARVKRDVANAKNVLGAKVPSAVSRLGKTLNDIASLDPASATTEQLLAAQQSLQGARQEFNAVDHAFKGGITVAGKPINTGLTLDMVKPQLDALNESQLRIQDMLESRGIQSGQIPGYQSPQDWLNFLDSPLYQQYTTGTPRFSEGVEFEPADVQNPEIAQALKGIQPGQTESGLRQLIARGLPARVPRPAPESLVPRAFGGGEDFAPVMSAIDAP